MRVTLLTSFNSIKEMIANTARAGLICTDNTHLLDNPDYNCVDFIKRRIEQEHESVIEHINLTFEIRNVSRALLQELARHRHISLSVESTRWTLKKTLLNNNTEIRAEAIAKLDTEMIRRIDEFKLSKKMVDAIRKAMKEVLKAINICAEEGEGADTVKYFLPELMPTNLVMTCNLRELRHIYSLRAHPPALEEFNELCKAIKETLPKDIQELLEQRPLGEETVPQCRV